MKDKNIKVYFEINNYIKKYRFINNLFFITINFFL